MRLTFGIITSGWKRTHFHRVAGWIMIIAASIIAKSYSSLIQVIHVESQSIFLLSVLVKNRIPPKNDYKISKYITTCHTNHPNSVDLQVAAFPFLPMAFPMGFMFCMAFPMVFWWYFPPWAPPCRGWAVSPWCRRPGPASHGSHPPWPGMKNGGFQEGNMVIS